ncbi:hypothetical protein PENTCL1PPCAC_7552, partial [Pristionchus entomophagus]
RYYADESELASKRSFIFYFSIISLAIPTLLFIFYLCYVVRRREIERPQKVHIPLPHPECDVEASIAVVKHAHCPRSAAATRSRTRSRSRSSACSSRRTRDTDSTQLELPMEPRVSFENGRYENEEQQPKSRPAYSQEAVPSERIFSRELGQEEAIQERVETPTKQLKTGKARTSSKDKAATKVHSAKETRRGSTPDSSPKHSSPRPSSSKDKTPKKGSSQEKSPRRSTTKGSMSPMMSFSSEPSLAARPYSGSYDDMYPEPVSSHAKMRSKSKTRTKSALISPHQSSGSRFTEFTLPPTTVSTQQEYVSERAPFE